MPPLSPIPFGVLLHNLRKDTTITTLDQAEALKGASSCCDLFKGSVNKENGAPSQAEYGARAARYLLAEGKLKDKRTSESKLDESAGPTATDWLVVDEVALEFNDAEAVESSEVATASASPSPEHGSLLQAEGEWLLAPGGHPGLTF